MILLFTCTNTHQPDTSAQQACPVQNHAAALLLQVNGSITYNGESFDSFQVARTCAYVSQVDVHTAELTVRETLDFAARCLGVGHKQGGDGAQGWHLVSGAVVLCVVLSSRGVQSSCWYIVFTAVPLQHAT